MLNFTVHWTHELGSVFFLCLKAKTKNSICNNSVIEYLHLFTRIIIVKLILNIRPNFYFWLNYIQARSLIAVTFETKRQDHTV